jgi:hypothetical protein
MFGTRASHLLILLVAFLPASAQAASPQEIASATSLLARGRLEEAEALIARLRAEPDPALQVLFLSGMLQIERRDYGAAAEEFRRMLSQDPSLLRPRLELARALYLAGDYQASLYHFEQVLAAPLPDAVRTNVLVYVAAIRERSPSLSIGVELVADSNPKQATSSETVEIGGRLYRLNPDAREESARGVAITVRGKLPLVPAPEWFLRGYSEIHDYPNSEFDFAYVQALAGRHIALGRHGIDIEVGGHYAAYQGVDLYRGANVIVTDFIRLRTNLTLTAALDARELDYERYPFLDGWQYVESLELRYALTPRQALRGGGYLVQGNAEADPFAFDGFGLNARYIQEWRGGWISSVLAQYARYAYNGMDPFFGEERDDKEVRTELTLSNRRLMWRGLLPALTLGYVNRDSNIEIYAFDRTYLRAGITKEF